MLSNDSGTNRDHSRLKRDSQAWKRNHLHVGFQPKNQYQTIQEQEGDWVNQQP